MPCYHPLRLEPEERGKVRVVPCGQCIGCRLERSRQWAVRLMHEAQLHDRKCFVTLTYSPEELPTGGTLVPEDLRLFIKRVRHWAKPGRVRFFGCGEYGEQCGRCSQSRRDCSCGAGAFVPGIGRAHYHAILFGVWFRARDVLGGEGASTYWSSDQLSALWPKGHSSFGRVSFESAGYVARYCVKKISGVAGPGHYDGRLAEFVRMSRNPGIGQGFFFGMRRICFRAMRLWCEVRCRSRHGIMRSSLPS